MRTLLRGWLKAEGVSQPRITKIEEHLNLIENKNLAEEDWLMFMDGTLGMRWRNNIKQITYDLESLNIDDTAILTLDKKQDGRIKKCFKLPVGFGGQKFAVYLNNYKEIIDFWVKRATVRLIELESSDI